MDNPGIYDIGSSAITVALTGEVITSVTDSNGDAQAYVGDLDGALGVGLQVRFSYGSGGTTCKVYVQTTLDQGDTWIDVACAAFTTSSATKVLNLSGLTAKTTAATPGDGALADDTAVDGIIGDRWRVKVTSTGTYAGSTTVAVRANFR
jgi:hypothetical protein